jgi:uncharacterized protein (DUF924 family)
MVTPENILNFWFADAGESPAAAAVRSKFWFHPNEEIDGEIWEQFGDAVSDAANGLYDHWLEAAFGRLALIIMLDQFPRNIFRGTAEVFRNDARALELAQQGVAVSQLAGLAVPEQAFLLMPYQHAEDISVQDAGVALYSALADAAAPEWQEAATGYRDFAILHRDIIVEFGRFPHRNEALGRTSTEQEICYLEDGGQTFGQAG